MKNNQISIGNYFEYNNNLAAGAQPDINQFNELKQNGVNVIVNLSPANTRNAIPEENKIVENMDMNYVHFPVDCSNLKPEHYYEFKTILNKFNGSKIFVHCGANIKSSNLIHMYQVLEQGKDEKESLETLKQIQNPEQKWFSYFKNMGMIGLQ